MKRVSHKLSSTIYWKSVSFRQFFIFFCSCCHRCMYTYRAVFTWLSKGIGFGFGFGFTTPFGWLVYLLWFWFYDSQVKTALYQTNTISSLQTDLKQKKQRTMPFTEKSWSNESNHMHTDGVEKINSPTVICQTKAARKLVLNVLKYWSLKSQ